MPIIRFYFLLFSICLICDQNFAQNSDDLLAQIFGTTPSTPSSTCECVDYYLCDNNTINTNGLNLIDIRNRACDDYLQVCCEFPNINKQSPPPPTETPRISTCGIRNTNGQGFRLSQSTDEAEYTEFPWMVALMTVRELPNQVKEFSYKCGAALIHPKVVVTAAHCVNNKKDKFVARAGEWDTQRKTEQYPTQDRNVKTVIIHPDFYSGGLHNDIGILILSEPFQLAPNVDVVCLPQHDFAIPENTICAVSGWGTDVLQKKDVYKAILKKVELPIMNRNTCQRNLRTTRLGARFILDNSFLCAGGEVGKDSCKGDGGSPLVCPVAENSDVYQLAGLVSWGVGCGQTNMPGIYANVPVFRQWIDEEMRKNNVV